MKAKVTHGRGRPPGSKNRPKSRENVAAAICEILHTADRTVDRANMLLLTGEISDPDDPESRYIRNFILCWRDFLLLWHGHDVFRNIDADEPLPRSRFGM